MGDGEKRYTEEQLEKVGELRASIQYAELQKEQLRHLAELQRRSMKEESMVGAVALSAFSILTGAQLYFNAETKALGAALTTLFVSILVFWVYRRRIVTKQRQIEFMKAQLELDFAITQANEAIREAKSGG